jgi:hypothetical protein
MRMLNLDLNQADSLWAKGQAMRLPKVAISARRVTLWTAACKTVCPEVAQEQGFAVR